MRSEPGGLAAAPRQKIRHKFMAMPLLVHPSSHWLICLSSSVDCCLGIVLFLASQKTLAYCTLYTTFPSLQTSQSVTSLLRSRPPPPPPWRDRAIADTCRRIHHPVAATTATRRDPNVPLQSHPRLKRPLPPTRLEESSRQMGLSSNSTRTPPAVCIAAAMSLTTPGQRGRSR